MTEFHPADFVKVSMLLVKPKTQEPSDVATAFSEASGYYAQLLKGDAWEKVLSQSKQDPQVIQTKGLIGWRPISAFPATGQVELKALKVGQYTHPVQTQFGVQIFRLEATGVTAPASELQDLKEKYAEGQRSGTLSRLRGAAKIQ
jgi:parvulin-like peptidyl-prolyl isomerase